MSEYSKGIFLVFTAGVLWSTIGIAVRLINDASVWQILFYRGISMSLFLFFVISVFQKQNPINLIRNNFFMNFVGGLSLFFAYLGGIYAIQKTSVANAMFLFACAPLLAAILARFILNEKVQIITWICILIALFGISIMVFDNSSSNSVFLGNISGIFSALGFAIFTVTLRSGKSNNMMPSVMFSGIIAVILTGIYCLSNSYNLILSYNDTLISLGMGVFQVGAGLVLYTLGSKIISAAEMTLLSLSEVLLGPFWVWLFLNESIKNQTFLGGLILFSSIIVNVLFTSNKTNKPN